MRRALLILAGFAAAAYPACMLAYLAGCDWAPVAMVGRFIFSTGG